MIESAFIAELLYKQKNELTSIPAAFISRCGIPIADDRFIIYFMNAARLAERLKADQLRAEMLAVERLDEDRVNADRIEADELYALLLVADRVDADLLYAKQIAAARLEEDRRLVVKCLPVNAKRIRAKLLAGRRRLAEQRSVSHVQTVDDKTKVELIKEMERVFSERFKEKRGGRIMSSELVEVFSKSTTISEFDENCFKYHSRNLFLGQWTNARCSAYQHKRCYTGVVVKSDE